MGHLLDLLLQICVFHDIRIEPVRVLLPFTYRLLLLDVKKQKSSHLLVKNNGKAHCSPDKLAVFLDHARTLRSHCSHSTRTITIVALITLVSEIYLAELNQPHREQTCNVLNVIMSQYEDDSDYLSVAPGSLLPKDLLIFSVFYFKYCSFLKLPSQNSHKVQKTF